MQHPEAPFKFNFLSNDAASAPPRQAPSTTAAAPPTVTKTVHLIRHGVARHNVPDARTGERPDLHDPRFTDPPLIRQGEMQASVLGEQLRRRGVVLDPPAAATASGGAGDGMDVEVAGDGNSSSSRIDLVVCSPLTRCLQTASHIFPSYFSGNDAPSSTASASASAEGNHVLDRNCRVCCHGGVREAYGMHYPDKRRYVQSFGSIAFSFHASLLNLTAMCSPLSQLKSNFPTVSYHPSLTENDDEWQPDVRETRQDVVQRVHEFFSWLLKQPHDNVAIVSHGVWIECALLHYCPDVLEFGRKRVYNCEVYRGELGLVHSSSENHDGTVVLRDVAQVNFYHA